MLASLNRLLAFDRQYQRDRQQSSPFLHRRDRRFALDCQAQQQTPALALWLARLAPEGDQGHDPRLRPWWQAGLLFIGAGALLGSLFMLALLYYDGGRQINITLFIALALLQLLLALASSLQSLSGWQPWRRLLPRNAHSSALTGLRPALAGLVTQLGGLAFATTALLTLLVLVVVQDLAFGWSTTLATSAAGYHRLLSTLASPWQSLWPAAVPSLELVSQSQFFRFTDSNPGSAELLTHWWPFLVMLWLCYVLLPRLLLAMLALAWLNWQAHRQLYRHPGWQALQYRLHTALVDTGTATPAQAAPASSDQGLSPLPATATLIRWATAGEPELLLQLCQRPQPLIICAGGDCSLAEDEQALQQACQRHEPVLLVTRGWQPPTGELSDFLADARTLLADGTLIALLPLASDDSLRVCPAPLLSQWQRFVARQQDPRLLLCQPGTADNHNGGDADD